MNVAARLEALAEPGGICVSRTVRNHVQDKLALAFEDLGERTLKNIPRPVHVFRVSRMAPRLWTGAGRAFDAGGCGPPRRLSCSWSPPAAPGCGCARTTARRQRRTK